MCTDVMARGVDIPEVNWVIQYDPPSSSKWVHEFILNRTNFLLLGIKLIHPLLISVNLFRPKPTFNMLLNSSKILPYDAFKKFGRI